MSRTEADILSEATVKITLGGTEYGIHPLRYKESRLWKQKAKPTIEKFEKLLTIQFDHIEEAFGALKSFTYETMDELVELAFDYDQSLPKEKILEECTEEEMLLFILETVKLAFPLVQMLASNQKRMMQK